MPSWPAGKHRHAPTESYLPADQKAKQGPPVVASLSNDGMRAPLSPLPGPGGGERMTGLAFRLRGILERRRKKAVEEAGNL